MENHQLKTAVAHLQVAKRHIERAEQECEEIAEGHRAALWIYNIKASVEQAFLILESELGQVEFSPDGSKIIRQSFKETA